VTEAEVKNKYHTIEEEITQILNEGKDKLCEVGMVAMDVFLQKDAVPNYQA
jgi:hypothetical protein